MHTAWKSRGRVSEVFAKFWEGGYIGVVKIFGGGCTFLVFYCIFINKFSKKIGGRVHFYPPSHPPHPTPFVHLCYYYQPRHLEKSFSAGFQTNVNWLKSLYNSPNFNNALVWSQMHTAKSKLDVHYSYFNLDRVTGGHLIEFHLIESLDRIFRSNA